MIHTPLDSLVCTEPTPTAAACAAARAPRAQQSRHLADRAAVESRLRGGDLLGLQDVELHDVLGRLELAHAEELARGLRVAEVVGERELVEQRPEIRALEHLEVGGGHLDLAEVGDVVRRELLQERRVVALDLAGQDDDVRALLAGVRVGDRLVDRLVGRRVGLLRRRAAGGRRRVAERGLRDRDARRLRAATHRARFGTSSPACACS